MNSFNLGGAKKPVIRREKVLVPTNVPKSNGASPQLGSRRPGPPSNRFQLSATTTSTLSKQLKNPAQRAVASTRGVKRKSATPQPSGPLWSDDEGQDDDSSEIGGSDSDASRKRVKSSVSSVESNGPRRTLASETVREDGKAIKFVHASTLTSKDQESKFKNAFKRDSTTSVSLQYPSRSPSEKFQLKRPRSDEDYKPMEDIAETVKLICEEYLPDELRREIADEEGNSKFYRGLLRAWACESTEDFEDTVLDFNDFLKPLVSDGTIHRELIRKTHMPLPWVKRILDQTYARTVSPRVDTLKAYKNGSDNVYGELLPDFVSEILHKTRLNHEQVFVDLGSGVGNVVLQAALEIGAESWGIEMMPNPCDLADLQAKEFPARAKLWGLNVGKVQLLRGDFTRNTRIGEVLKRADVVLVNNQAFTAALNETLLSMFLDLKEGCQVVSLKPFVPVGHKINMRNVDSPVNMFVQREAEYFSNRVSWTDRSGTYYYATKDLKPLRNFQRRMEN
jgi:H3 lysine-79-specific histone-lysine N-methyltransferase